MSGYVWCMLSFKQGRHNFFPKKSETRARYERHECDTNDTSATQMKNFDFDNNTSKNIFSHPYIYYMASERLRRGTVSF